MKSHMRRRDVVWIMAFSSLYYFLFTYKSVNSYFYYDDFDSLSWISVYYTYEFIIDTFDFNHFARPQFYRPFGSLVHSIWFKLFGLNFLPYHILGTFFHLFNLFAVCILISKFVTSKSAVFLGTFLFTFHVTTIPIYWHFFGTFDSQCAAFLLISFLFYIKSSDNFNFWYFLAFFCFLLSLRAKEMPLSFPLTLIVYETLIRNKKLYKWDSLKLICRAVWPFFVIALTAGLLKYSAQMTVEETNTYAAHLDVMTLLKGLNFFVKSALFEMRLPIYISLSLLAILGLVPLLLKSKTLTFAFLFTLILVLPILPMANRRADYNQYIPLIGVSLYSAVLFDCLKTRFQLKAQKFVTMLYVVVGVLCVLHSVRSWHLKKPIEERYLNIAHENRELVKLLAPNKAGQSATYLFDSAPSTLSPLGVFGVLHLLFRDHTITVKFISDCNKNIPDPVETDIACISFSRRTVRIWRASEK